MGQAGACGGACGEARGLAADDAVEDAIVLFQPGSGRVSGVEGLSETGAVKSRGPVSVWPGGLGPGPEKTREAGSSFEAVAAFIGESTSGEAAEADAPGSVAPTSRARSAA